MSNVITKAAELMVKVGELKEENPGASALYLGTEEYQAIRAVRRGLKGESPAKMNGDRPEYDGLSIYKVNAKSHMAVA